MVQLDEIVHEFLVESCENVDRIDRDLVALEQNPEDRTILAGIFRSIHTIKGTCGFLGFGRLESVSHVGENLLSKLRDGEMQVTEEITSVLLSLVDAVRSMLSEIENTGKDGANVYSDLVAKLTALQQSTESEKVEQTYFDSEANAKVPTSPQVEVAPATVEPDPANIKLPKNQPLRPLQKSTNRRLLELQWRSNYQPTLMPMPRVLPTSRVNRQAKIVPDGCRKQYPC